MLRGKIELEVGEWSSLENKRLGLHQIVNCPDGIDTFFYSMLGVVFDKRLVKNTNRGGSPSLVFFTNDMDNTTSLH